MATARLWAGAPNANSTSLTLALPVLCTTSYRAAVSGLFHLLDPSAPCTSLHWAPGLPLSTKLFEVVAECVKAEGTDRQASMRLAERLVQLAAEVIVNKSAHHTGTAVTVTVTTGSASDNSPSKASADPASSGGSEPASKDSAEPASTGSGSEPTSNASNEPSSWYGGLGSLLVSMA